MLAILLIAVVAVASTTGVFGMSPPQPDSYKPCDCYVDLHGDYSYINMWKGYPCSGYSFGALYQDRCLYYVYDHWGNTMEQWANCYGNSYQYIKMRTQSGKSKGWVAYDYLNCNYGNMPPPAAAAIVAMGTPNIDDKNL